MKSSTHVRGGMLISVIGFTVLSYCGLLLDNVSPFLQFLIIYPYTLWGSKLSDFDHGIVALPSRDYASIIVWHILHVADFVQKLFPKGSLGYRGADFFRLKHRSFATHSDVTVLVMFVVYLGLLGYGVEFMSYRLGYGYGLSEVSRAVGILVLTGLIMGVLSHLVLDALTPSGVYLFVWTVFRWLVWKVFGVSLRKRVSLVPSWEYFATGGKWETGINKLLNALTWLSILWVLYLMYSPVRFVIGGYVL